MVGGTAPDTARPLNGTSGACRTPGSQLEIVLDRPDVHNAFSAAMRDELVEILQVAISPIRLSRR